MSRSKTSVCWISSARYSQPLDAMAARKWQLMAALEDYDIHIVGFSTSLRPRRFTEQRDASRCCRSRRPRPCVISAFSCSRRCWSSVLTLQHRAEIVVAQSPFEGAIGAVVKRFARLLGRRIRLIIENHNNFEEDLFLQRTIPLQAAIPPADVGSWRVSPSAMPTPCASSLHRPPSARGITRRICPRYAS